MFRRFYDEVRNGNDRHTSGKEDPRVRPRPGMLKRDGNGNKDEKPIDRHGNFPANCVVKVISAAVTLSIT
jgi:hypothetical protein